MNNKTNASLINGQLTSGSDIPCSGVAPTAIPDYREEEGVSPNYVQNSTMPIEPDKVWFYMRVAYGQEKKVADYLSSQGIETFLPKCIKEYNVAGYKKQVETSLIPNALFVHSTESILKKYTGKFPTENLHHFYKPNRDVKGKPIGAGRTPIIIPDNQMKSFQIWTKSDNPMKIFIDNLSFQFKKNDLVKIVTGEFAGFLGHVVRLKGQTRVGITIEGVGFVSTAYISKRLLEKIE